MCQPLFQSMSPISAAVYIKVEKASKKTPLIRNGPRAFFFFFSVFAASDRRDANHDDSARYRPHLATCARARNELYRETIKRAGLLNCTLLLMPSIFNKAAASMSVATLKPRNDSRSSRYCAIAAESKPSKLSW